MLSIRFRTVLLIMVGVFLTACSSSRVNQSTNALLNGDFSHVFSPATQASDSDFAHAPSSVLFNNMDGYWKHAKAVSMGGVEINTFVPHDQEASNWTKRLEITHVAVKPAMSVGSYYQRIVKPGYSVKCDYSQNQSSIRQHSNSDLLFEYHLKNCGKQADQIIIGRIMRSPHSISTISYAVKSSSLSDNMRQNMMQLLTTSRVIRD